MVKRILSYFNPLSRLGYRHYSYKLPFLVTVASSIVLEFYANIVIKNPHFVDLFAIFLYIAYIIYFAFRDGLLGGLTATAVTIVYYFYIIYSRHYTGQQLSVGLETTFILTGLYIFLAGTIGWLKQTIDKLIERETDEKRRLQSIVQ